MEIPAGHILFNWQGRMVCTVELGRVLFRHNGYLLSPKAAGYALWLYIEALSRSFGTVDLRGFKLHRIDPYYQWRVEGLGNFWPHFELYIGRLGRESTFEFRNRWVLARHTKYLAVRFYDKTAKMMEDYGTYFQDELLSPPPGLPEYYEWMVASKEYIGTERYAKELALWDEHRKDGMRPKVYHLPELRDIIRYEVELRSLRAQNSGILNADNLCPERCMDIFDGERIIAALNKHFPGVNLGPATNAAEMLFASNEDGGKYKLLSLVLHDHPELLPLFVEHLRDEHNERVRAKEDGRTRREKKENQNPGWSSLKANLAKYPVKTYEGARMEVPTWEDIKAHFDAEGRVWYFDDVTADGEYLYWQASGKCQPFTDTEMVQWGGRIRRPRPNCAPHSYPSFA